MGKAERDQELGIPEDLNAAAGEPALRRCRIGRIVSLRCVAALLLSGCVLLSAIFWLPPLRRSGAGSDDAAGLAAQIQASFILQKPMTLLAAHTERLEYDIYEEIGVPDSKVSVISMHPLGSTNSTYVVFGVLPDSKYVPISSPAVSVLRSSLTELVLQQLNLSLTPPIFGHPSSFEVLRFPGGITVIPVQSASLWERNQVLFHFRLNNSIFQIQKNLDELKNQLKLGLHLRPYENVYVQMRNDNGSTAAPPVTVQASVLSDIGSQSLLPDRLKQLAHVITGSHSKNLGLDHSIFGRVKQLQLSSYLQHSISSQESPSPSPSPSAAPPQSQFPVLSPYAPAPAPSTDHYRQEPCLYCMRYSPSESPLLHAPVPQNAPQPPCQSSSAPGPSVTDISPSPTQIPYVSSLYPPSPSPTDHPYPPTSYTSPYPAPPDKSLGPTFSSAPAFSSLPPGRSYSSRPLQHERSNRASMSPMSASSPISPSQSSHAGPHLNAHIRMIGLLVFLVFYLLYELN